MDKNNQGTKDKKKFLMDVQPRQTLYVHNLNDKLKKSELKKQLYCLFTQYGRIVDIIALKTTAHRGQAFIIFTELSSAIMALKSLQDFKFFGKPMKIQFAKKSSKIFGEIGQPSLPSTAKHHDRMDVDTLDLENQGFNNTIFIERLPSEMTQASLQSLFEECHGFVEAQLIPGDVKKGFIEFDTIENAAVAMKIFNGYQIFNVTLSLQYVKK